MEPDPMSTVPAVRMTTHDGVFRAREESCLVAEEVPLTIDVRNAGVYTVMCTPGEQRALAIGFLYSEGLIDSVRDISLLNECVDTPNVVRVVLQGNQEQAAQTQGGRLVMSSCGNCGMERVAERLEKLPKVAQMLRVSPALLNDVSQLLKEKQVLFTQCGGTHAALVFDGQGKALGFAEDIGRHNALDKAIGKCLLQGVPTTGCGAMLSGRVSLEMVDKCARAGIELIGAVSAPTALAIEAANRSGITLCAFVREQRASAFTHLHRMLF